VLAGGAWVRFRSAHSSGTAADLVAPAAQGRPVPDVTARDAFVESGAVRITLSISPRPPVGFEHLRVRVRVDAAKELPASAARPVVLDGGEVTFEMAMPMGDHRYTLVRAEDGWWQADVVLPSCGSGDLRWSALVDAVVAGTRRTAKFQFDLQRPKE
jgi:hypothetical protein